MMDNKKIKNNLLIGIFGQLSALVLGILVPKLVLNNYGSEINGLLSSVSNIYSYIAIVEAGIAAAACQALYKAIAAEDRDQINAVMSATNKYYQRTGFIYFLLIVLFAVSYPVFISTEIPYTTVALVILFNGIGNVVNYFFHGKYLIFLKADGKHYVRAGIELFINSFKQISKIVLISIGFDVVFVQAVAMLAGFLQMICITYYVNKHYSWIDLKVEPDHSAISQSRHVFVHEINYLITSNVDVVLLTFFSTLKVVSVYSIYTLLFGIVSRVLQTIKEAFEFKIANTFHRDREAYLRLFEAYEVYYIAIAFSLFTIVNYFILPFLKIYTAGVTDIEYIDQYLPFLFTFVNLLSSGRYPSDAMVHISGHFRQTKRSAMIETIMNLVLSLMLVRPFGIYGVLAGTILSSLYRTNYLIAYVNKNIIGRNVQCTYKCWAVCFGVYVFAMWLSGYIQVTLDSYVSIFAFCIPYTLCILLLYITVVSMFMPDNFRYVMNAVGIFRKSAWK